MGDRRDKVRPPGRSRIEDVRPEDQHEAVLATVQEIAHKEDYEGEDDEGEPRCPEYGDIAVVTQDFDI